jgi:hypothetical protein
MKNCFVIIALLLTACLAVDGFACGDSLYRVGKGVSYRVYTAPLPGSVLVYGDSEGAQQLAEELARSGHGVQLVSDSDELKSELGSGSYDVVIAAYSDRDTVTTMETAFGNTTTTYIPVAQTEEEEAEAKRKYDHVLMAQQDKIKNYLKAIHKTLKAKT